MQLNLNKLRSEYQNGVVIARGAKYNDTKLGSSRTLTDQEWAFVTGHEIAPAEPPPAPEPVPEPPAQVVGGFVKQDGDWSHAEAEPPKESTDGSL